MSVKVSLHQLQDRLPELLDQVAQTGEEYIVERDGKDCAVIVNVQQWRRRNVGKRLDALGPEYRLSRAKQMRTEKLLAAQQRRTLNAAEQSELKGLLRDCDAILARRAAALDRLP